MGQALDWDIDPCHAVHVFAVRDGLVERLSGFSGSNNLRLSSFP